MIPYGTSVPTLTVGEFSYDGVAFGGLVAGSTYQTQTIAGIDGIPVTNQDTQRPVDTGAFAGVDVGAERDITIGVIVQASTASALATARQTLAGVMAPRGNVESPLFICAENATFAVMARPQKFNFPWDVTTRVTGSVLATMLFRCTDPRIYATPTQQTSAQSVSGLKLPFSLPGILGGTSTFTVTNSGTMESRPVLVFSGPSVTPGVMNTSITGSPAVSFGVTLASGDVMTVDMAAQTAVVVRSGSSVSTSVQGTLVAGSSWWTLEPGANALQYFSGGPADTGTMVVQYASAYVGI